MVNEVMKFITSYDKEVGEAIEAECARQRRNLELIASENIVSEPVMMAMGTVLTNKYAEGYSGKRYYGGCECVDVVETLAINRAKELFGCDSVSYTHLDVYKRQIVLIVLAFLHPLIRKMRLVYPVCALFTGVVSIGSEIPALAPAVGRLPLHELGLQWIVPAAAGGILGAVLSVVWRRGTVAD